MGAVRLGRMLLHWCDSCGIPLLEGGDCGICGSGTRRVEMTPPGDPRPAFDADLDLIREVVDDQFGEGTGRKVIPPGRIVLLNRTPALDRMDEVIIGGEVVGALRYDLDGRWRFVMRMISARSIQREATRGCVVADRGAVDPIITGKNLLAPGVIRVHEGIEPGDEVLVLDPDGRAIATGTARMPSLQMMEGDRGVSVKTRWTLEPGEPNAGAPSRTWEDVVRANRAVLDGREREAIEFVQRTMGRYPLPAVVSFSGGKDSLACSMITLEAGLSLPLLFVNTSLEFPETVAYVRDFASEHGLQLITGSASPRIFMECVERFGPPGRDFRWCCKTNKLGPTVRTIIERFPEGVLSFIGQRRYESESRSEKPRIWRNPWVPGQVGAAPIQDWTSMHVWVYIFSKQARYNPWYEKGLDRIGCYVCPACDLGERFFVEGESPEFRGWKEELSRFARERGLPGEWVEYALYRWRRVPGSLRQELQRLGVRMDRSGSCQCGGLDLPMNQVEQLDGGVVSSGSFTLLPDVDVLENLLNQLGEVRAVDGSLKVGDVTIDGNGVLINSPDRKTAESTRVRLLKIAQKALGCVGCGVCLGNCKKRALHLRGERAWIDGGHCVHCGECIEPCPALSFSDVDFEF